MKRIFLWNQRFDTVFGNESLSPRTSGNKNNVNSFTNGYPLGSFTDFQIPISVFVDVSYNHSYSIIVQIWVVLAVVRTMQL